MKVYIGKSLAIYKVSDGISNGTWWMTVIIAPFATSQKRVVSKNLPLRNSKEEAQADLDAYAERNGLVAI